MNHWEPTILLGGNEPQHPGVTERKWDGKIIAECADWETAAMIAAAPDMLDALDKIADWIDHCGIALSDESPRAQLAFRALYDAVKKARVTQREVFGEWAK